MEAALGSLVETENQLFHLSRQEVDLCVLHEVHLLFCPFAVVEKYLCVGPHRPGIFEEGPLVLDLAWTAVVMTADFAPDYCGSLVDPLAAVAAAAITAVHLDVCVLLQQKVVEYGVPVAVLVEVAVTAVHGFVQLTDVSVEGEDRSEVANLAMACCE